MVKANRVDSSKASGADRPFKPSRATTGGPAPRCVVFSSGGVDKAIFFNPPVGGHPHLHQDADAEK